MINSISSLVLPKDHPQFREPLPGTTVKKPTFWDTYDSRTLIYDCIHDPHTRRLYLFCPPALNFLPLFEDALFEVDGKRLGPYRHVTATHHDCFIFENVRATKFIRCHIAGLVQELRVNPINDGLRNLNVLYTMMKNEKLEWIRDWAQYHIRRHGAQAIVLCDNGSDDYDISEVDAVLSGIKGLKKIEIISTPLRHSPKAEHCTRWSGQKFLQAAMINVMRLRFCARAGAMLCLDTDELVVGRNDESIFDATRRSLFGYIAFRGSWRYAKPSDRQVRHSDHTLVNLQDKTCYTKYCVRPNSLIGRNAPLQVHNVRFGPRKKFIRDKRFTYLHCRNISTSWKYDRGVEDTEQFQNDPLAERQLKAAFSENMT